MARSTETKWLLPASLTEFDPACSSPNVEEALKDQCSLVGTFDSCTIGCNKDAQQEALWKALPDTILGVPLEKWTVANGKVWQELRGMLAGFNYFNNRTGSADIFSLMETAPSSSYIEPFANLSDRAFWVINQTATVLFEPLIFNYLAYPQRLNAYSWLFNPDEMAFVGSQCFAASNPAPAESVGQFSGPTGMYCSTTDFLSLYNQTFVNFTGRGYLYSNGFTFLRFYSSKIKDSIKAKYGPVIGPSKGFEGDDEKFGQATCYAFSAGTTSFTRCALIDDGANYASCPIGNSFTYDAPTCSCERFGEAFKSCARHFTYPWFPSLYYRERDRSTLQSSGPFNKRVTSWHDPPDATTHRMFRLPVVDISQIQCTPSPFTGAHRNNPNALRPNANGAGNGLKKGRWSSGWP